MGKVVQEALGRDRSFSRRLSHQPPASGAIPPLLHERMERTRQTLNPQFQTELEDLTREPIPEIYYQGLLSFSQRLQDQGKPEAAAEIYANLVQSPLSPEIQQRAGQRLDALLGKGSVGPRAEVLLRDFSAAATNYRLIVPMLAGSAVYQVARASVLSRLIAGPGVGWWTRGLGARLTASTVGMGFEVPVFSLGSRGLMALGGETIPWDGVSVGKDLLGATITLGALKVFGYFGNWAVHSVRARGAIRELPLQLIPQAAMFSGLMAAHWLEEGVGLRPQVDGATTVTDVLASMVNLGIGAHLGHRVLGARFSGFQKELTLRSQGKAVPDLPASGSLSTTLLATSGSRAFLRPVGPVLLEKSLSVSMAGSLDPFNGNGNGNAPARPVDHSQEESLHLLFAQYAGEVAAKPEVLLGWPGLKERIEKNILTLEDWELLRSMFQTVARRPNLTLNKWFLQVSRRFGTADHLIREPKGPEAAVNREDPFAGLGPVDSLRLGALVAAYGLTEKDLPVAEGLRRYLGLAPEFRTHFTEQVLVVDQVIQSVLSLQPQNITRALQARLKDTILRNYFELTFIDLKDLLFEHETLPSLINNTIMNILYGGKQSINLYRVHINMTTINEKDGTNLHGNIYLDTVKGWFQEKFGRIHVIQNPERTTFEFIAPSTRQVRESMSDFATEIKTRIATTFGVDPEIVGHFLPKAVISGRNIHRGNLYDYAIRSYADAEIFRSVMEFDNRLNVDELKGVSWAEARKIWRWTRPDIDGIRSTGNPTLIKTLNAMIIKATLELNGDLAAQTTFFEKEYAALRKRRNGAQLDNHQSVFTEEDLPRKGQKLFARWKAYRSKKSGYVGPGQYHPAYHNPVLKGKEMGGNPFFEVGADKNTLMRYEEDPSLSPEVNHLLRIIPRMGHIKGLLSHQRAGSEGGLIEQFNSKMLSLADAAKPEVGELLADWQGTAKKLWNAMLHFYSLAVTDPRNAWTPKQHRQFLIHRGTVLERVASNFFIQEVALTGNTNLAALEYDSFKAFNDAHARQDEIDVDYNRVRDAIFLAAKQLSMPMPIVNPSGGDHISLSFSDRNLAGEAIDPVAYCRLVQKIVKDGFADRPYQDLQKVEMRELKLQSESMDRLASPEFLEELRLDMELSTVPEFHSGSKGEGTLLIPLRDQRNQEMSLKKILNYLEERGITAKIKLETRQIHRLPIWKRSGGHEENRDYWVFAKKPPAGFEPFRRTLTVSMSLGKHATLQEPGDVVSLMDLEDRLGIRLAAIKEGRWPYKEGFGIIQMKAPK